MRKTTVPTKRSVGRPRTTGKTTLLHLGMAPEVDKIVIEKSEEEGLRPRAAARWLLRAWAEGRVIVKPKLK